MATCDEITVDCASYDAPKRYTVVRGSTTVQRCIDLFKVVSEASGDGSINILPLGFECEPDSHDEEFSRAISLDLATDGDEYDEFLDAITNKSSEEWRHWLSWYAYAISDQQ